MALVLRHAKLSQRDCKDCWLYVYNENSGEREQWRGRPVKRPWHSAPPCFHNKCKKKGPDAFAALLPHNEAAYNHYLECKATGHFPDDPIVKRNARLIRLVEDELSKVEHLEQMTLTAVSLGSVKIG